MTLSHDHLVSYGSILLNTMKNSLHCRTCAAAYSSELCKEHSRLEISTFRLWIRRSLRDSDVDCLDCDSLRIVCTDVCPDLILSNLVSRELEVRDRKNIVLSIEESNAFCDYLTVQCNCKISVIATKCLDEVLVSNKLKGLLACRAVTIIHCTSARDKHHCCHEQ